MSQGKVSDFFSTKKKRTADVNPSKRRKIDPTIQTSSTRASSRASSKLADSDKPLDVCLDGPVIDKFSSDSKNLFVFSAKKEEPVLAMANQQRSTRNSKSKPVKISSKNKPPKSDKFQMKLTELISASSKSSCQKEKDIDITSLSDKIQEDDNHIENGSYSMMTEEITSIDDDHDFTAQGLCTPRKRNVVEPDSSSIPKTRTKKLAPRRLSDENKERLVKKNQELSVSFLSENEATQKGKADVDVTPGTESSVNSDTTAVDAPALQDKVMMKADLLALMSSVASPPMALSPLPKTPDRTTSDSPPPTPSPKKMSPKLQNLSQKLNNLNKMSGQEKTALKNRLKQSGKLGDMKLKEKLAEMSSALAKSKEMAAVKETAKAAEPVGDENKEDKTEKSKPAWQKYDYLTKPGSGSVCLPLSYRLLEQAFQAMDTVVSMMHNRSEICTFSKLKAACQNITRKNFEEKAIGQIKTISPEAYTLRQEKNVPSYGQKVYGYQLTIEPNLSVKDSDSQRQTKEGKPVFTASMLLARKAQFKQGLMQRVHGLHQEFLSTLDPPVRAPSDRLTRWHPRFPLDWCGEVPPAPLPPRPDVKVYHTAMEVLEANRGKVNPKVEAALAKVAAANAAKEASAPPTPAAPTPPLPKGIPAGLLEKIRAKQAAKMALDLTRNPEQEAKARMLRQLPDMIRILRGLFITEKKPALPVETVYGKVKDSFRTAISMRDVEAHMELLQKEAPELVTLVTVQRGTFLKLNKTVDTNTLAARLTRQAKELTE